MYARCPVTSPCSQGTENLVGGDWSFQLCSLRVWAHRWYAVEQVRDYVFVHGYGTEFTRQML